MYYKTEKNNLFYEPTKEIVEKYNLQKITKEEFDELAKPTIDEVKKIKRNEIFKSFEINLNDLKNGLQVENIGVVDCGKQHLTNVQGLIKVVESGAIENVNFRLFDNSTTKLNLEQLKKIELAIILKDQELYVKKWELEQAINSALSLEEVEQIKWEY